VTILLLTGPPASGKNTIAELVAKRLERCVAIDVDELRTMIVQPSRAPWQSKEQLSQERLSVDNACAIARNAANAGYDVVISDVVTDMSLDAYKQAFAGTPLKTIVLLPTEDEIMGRLLSRPDYLSRGEVTSVYDQQAKFDGYDDRLDNTNIDPDDVVDWLLERWKTTTAPVPR
jgi:adenylate kinase family enzyme